MPAPEPALGAAQASASGTNRYSMQLGVMRAVTRSHVPSPVAIDYQATRSNRAA